MKLWHRGLTIELAEDDPRVPIMEALLFGRTLPPPLPMPDLPDTVPPAPVVPPVAVTPEQRAFWRQLRTPEQRELLLLTAGAARPADVEKALGLTQRKLMGCHSRLARLALKHRVNARVRTVGRTRRGKWFWVADDCVAWIRALAAESGTTVAVKEGEAGKR